MLTYTGMWGKCQELSQDYSTPSKTFFQGMLSIGKTNVEAELGIYYTLDQSTDTTIAGTFQYTLPARCIRLKTVKIVVGGRTQILDAETDEDLWNQILAAYPSQSSDYAQRLLAKRKTFEIYPTPASNGNTMYLDFEAGYPDFSYEDYSDGTITTATLGAKAIVGSGTAFAANMVGKVLRIGSFPQEYDIASVTDATNLTLAQPYEGVSIAAGSAAYIIGETMRTPDSTHMLPVYYALWMYYAGKKQSSSKAASWKKLYEDGLKTASAIYGKRYTSKYIAPNRRLRQGAKLANPNFTPPALT